ncbi:baseplate assembly protein [Salmonella enterica subsp. salamae]|nr:baseplate assembly protein [Salmonella enterica subsp. salamae]ECJ2281385.1 baseplate assembly protein [Salmonella enterica subsp. salamae]
MQGMNRTTGQPLSGTDHIRQSVTDILTTPVGSRVMLETYGSDLPYLVDNPSDTVTQIRIVMSTAVALSRWEPRIRINSVNIAQASPGKIALTIAATDVETERAVLLEDIGL